ncbi:hypothetical protein MIMGU_mgv1a007091mg [Erythranthe guttata]|uniref:Hydroxyproline-rich glycoprotein family protein n=1 Tax=Erythranthe guttata TaxID=4155 RepID=A0A022QQ79_ERYGU|nr:hypothetical protein MIMGU_mgv1a007091mg [Erythranthe guttata]
MKSLKQGQSRSFLTQASRHHAAQLYFFKKAVGSLEAIEPHVRLLAEQHHIDYQFSGLHDMGENYDEDDESYDDDDDEDDDTEDSFGTPEEGELSFDYGQNGPVEEVSTIKNSMELDNTDATFSPELKLENLQSPARNSFSFQKGARVISKSAPLFPEKRTDSTERMTPIGPSPSRKFTSYVLPTPDETKIPSSGKLFNEVPQTRQQPVLNLRHSSPLDQNKYEKFHQTSDKLSGPIILDTQSLLKESNNPTTKATPLPPPFSEGLTGPIATSPFPPPFSGSLLRTPLPRPTSTPKLSSRLSPTFVSSPKISELHELPRPPAHLIASRRPSHSGPLISKRNEMSTASVSTSTMSTTTSALPAPPQGLPRSYSIPAGGGLMEVGLRVPLEGSQNMKMAEDIASPPLTPITLTNVQPTSSSTR